MNRVLPITLLLLCACTVIRGETAPYKTRHWRALEDRNVSRLGRAVMRGSAGSWIHAETGTFTYHAATRERLDWVIREAEWTYAEVSRRLGLPPASERGHFFVVENKGDWARVMRAAGRREYGVALHVGREVFLLRDAHAGTSYLAIPHEMVHYRLWQEYDREVPLWLEEGLAVWLGWDVAQAYQDTRYLKLYRQQEPVQEEHWIPWPTLLALERYPDRPVRMAAFYRQTGQLVREIIEGIGDERLREFVETMMREQRSLREVLVEEFEWSAEEVAAMKERVEHAVKHPAETAE